MTVETAAIILGLDASTVRYHIGQGNLRATRYGKAYEISASGLADFFSVWAPGAGLHEFLKGREGGITDQAALGEIDKLKTLSE